MTQTQIIKQITPFRMVSLVAIILAVVVIYQFGWLKVRGNVHQEGVAAGKAEISNLILQNLNQFGKIQLNVPDKDGKLQAIILVPQAQ